MAVQSYFAIPILPKKWRTSTNNVLPEQISQKFSRPWGVTYSMAVGALQDLTAKVRVQGYAVAKVSIKVMLENEILESGKVLPFLSSTDWLLVNELRPIWHQLKAKVAEVADWVLVLHIEDYSSNKSIDAVLDASNLLLQQSIDRFNDDKAVIRIAASLPDTDIFRLAS